MTNFFSFPFIKAIKFVPWMDFSMKFENLKKDFFNTNKYLPIHLIKLKCIVGTL